MFKVGELVATLYNEKTGLVIDTKYNFYLQYCRVLLTGEKEPRWFVYTSLKEKENGSV